MGSGSQKRFVDWEEKFVSHDRGSRVVHYYLRDRHGYQCLAVVGTERSLRHMVYVVRDDFLPLAGLDKSTTSAFKWRARREVVDWLSSFVNKTRSPEAVLSAGSPSGPHLSTDGDSSFSHEGADGLESGQEECRSRHYDNDAKKQCSVSKGDVVWMGSAWNCRKRLRHFSSFRRNGITISVQSFVYVMTEEKDRHIAYVEDLYEDKKLRKRLRVRWFHKTNELDCIIPPPAPHAREVFFTPFQQDLSVECVDGVATVLAPQHHEACLSTLAADNTARALMCYREFDGDGIKPFSIQEVKGYWRQPILSLAGVVASRIDSPQFDQGSEDFEMDDEEAADPGRLIKRGPRTTRCVRRRTGRHNKMSSRSSGDGAGDSEWTPGVVGGGNKTSRSSGDGAGDSEWTPGGAGGSASGDLQGNEERNLSTSPDGGPWGCEVGDHVEVLSEDSGLRGCWFKATILERYPTRVKVRYDNLTWADEEGNLEESISSCKLAGPCKLGIRISGRPCIRPFRTEPASQVRLDEGEIVDAWWNDGWWEGILCGKGSGGQISVFIPGELETVEFKPADLRVSNEWVNGTWAAIPSYPDVVMLLGLTAGQGAMDKNVTKRTMGQWGESSRYIEQGQTPSQERCRSPVKILEDANVEAARPSQNGHDCDRSAKDFGVSVKEESGVGTQCEQDEQDSSSRSATRSPRSAGPLNPIRLVFRQLQQDPQDDGISSDIKQNRVVLPSDDSKVSTGIGLKWKVGRKRHRQGDLTSRVERNVGHSAKDCSMEILKEEVSSDGDNGESAPLDDAENLPRWRCGDGEETVKHKRQRKGNDSNLKALHATPMGSAMFIGSLPIANLVMSR